MKSINIMFWIVGIAGCMTAHAADEWVSFNGEKGTVQAGINGMVRLQGSSSAVYSDAENTHRIDSRNSRIVGAVQQYTADTPFGEASVSKVTYEQKDSPLQYTLILKRLKNLKAFTVQGILHNRSDEDFRLHAFDLLNTRDNAGGAFELENKEDWLVTPLMEDAPAFSFAESGKMRIKEAALLSPPAGPAILVGPVGPAEAYTRVETGNNGLLAVVQMDKVLLRAGESRRSEEMIFLFEPVEKATDVWTQWVAHTHGARLHRGPVYGWCSWYDRTTKIDAEHVLDITETIEENPGTFGRGIIQIDDGYQKMDGDWSANEKFPQGMAAIAKRIRAAGCIPGVWFAPLMINPDHPWIEKHPDAIQKNAKGIASFMNANPFHPDGAKWVNPSHPATKKFLFNIISDARERGFGYIKIDFNGIGSRFVDPTKTRLQIFRELYALYRQAAGEEMYILSCLGSPTRGVIGFIDAARIGPDSHPAHFDKCLKSVLRFQIYNNVWWHNDPDVSYLAPQLESRRVGYTPQGEGMWKTWHNTVALVGGTAMISEPINMPDVKEVWRNYEIMRPGSSEPAKLLTLGRSELNEIFGFSAQRPYGDFAVYNLYNPTGDARSIQLNFEEAGLPSNLPCAVFDFWENAFVGFEKETYATDELPSLSARLLRFTPLAKADEGVPVLIGSNLHLSMGATEIEDIHATDTFVRIKLTTAGAQNGCLTFFSTQSLASDSANNCTILSIEQSGENIWQVNLKDRDVSAPQMITLKAGK